MGLLGKYTTYVGGKATAQHTLLAKLFPAGADYPTMSAMQTALQAGKETDAQAVIQANATAPVVNGVGGLVPSDGVQQGDPGMFPVGVKLGYGDSPDIPGTVNWASATSRFDGKPPSGFGGPASPYIPDVRSPDPLTGNPLGTAPDAADVAQIAAEGTKEDPGQQNLKNPALGGPAIYGNNTIGAPQKMGDSGGNV